MADIGAFVFVLLSLCQLAATEQVRLCVWSAPAKLKCDEMSKHFRQANLGELMCVQAQSQYACMRLIESGAADIIKIGATDLFAAEKFFQLKPILKEAKRGSNDAGYLYKAVVIVRANNTITGLNDLYKKKSCHTGVGRTVGWTVPVSNLQAKGVLPVQDCDNTVRNVANFFSQSCAPGAYDESNNVNGDNPANVCTLCSNPSCPPGDEYGGYEGAVRCLLNDRGDVAFAKHSTINDLQSSDSTIRKESFSLLCPDGSVKHVDEWPECFWATRPTDVIATSSTKSESAVSAIRTMLIAGANKFHNGSAGFNMFSSTNYNGSNVLFRDDMQQLLGVTSGRNDPYIGTGYLNTMINYTTCTTPDRWCVVSTMEENKCKDMSAAFAAARITNRMSCVRAQSHKECMEKIASGDADLVTLDGGDVYTAGKYHNLVPIMAESYKEVGTTSYWAVAVVHKTNTDININNLKGKTSCHTGIQKTSGWNIPIGTLVEKGSISVGYTQCSIVEAVGKFFSKSCVPGALDPKYNPTGKNPASLCELCGGKKGCQRSNTNKYYGYKGAFRCLVEKNADVAFVKHTTVIDNTDGKLNETWARDLKSSDYELLCADGTRKNIHAWQECSLAQVPSHAVVTSNTRTRTERKHYATVLKKGQYKFGKSSSGFQMFSSDAIFDDSTFGLSDILEDQQNYEKWLGSDYIKAMAALDKKACTSAGVRCVTTHALLWFLLVAVIQ